jgi:Zn-dependent peptidase ImmA (M78 family)
MARDRFNPWRAMRALGPVWKLRWSHLLPDDTYGYTDHSAKTIVMRKGMSFEERRCTIAHEVQHAIRGPVAAAERVREELEVDRIASRLLIPSVRDLADAMILHHGQYELAAEELWVDPWMLEVRLSSMQHLERGYYERRMVDVPLLGLDH